MAPLVRTGGSRHTGLAAPPHRNIQRMEGYLRTAGYQILNLGEDFLFSSDSLLDKIRNRYQNWLEQLLRLIYNSGGFLVPVRW